jgi:lipopolysaccharide/colanic/teichoic acid biosynthesis glycosyltransferase
VESALADADSTAEARSAGTGVTGRLSGWGRPPGPPDPALVASQPFRPYRTKRLVDLALLAVVAVPALLVGAACAVAVRLTSRGPVLFLQERVGLGGQPFVVWKFRTMVNDDNPVFPDADRITSAGRWLRRLSLDELPQLVNVWRGEMSVVGPRPTLAYQVERYDDRQAARLCVRPGLTGLAQVRGRNALSWGERIEHDLEYVQTQSPWLDARIVVDTVVPLLTGRGAEGHPTDDPLAATAAE